VAWPEANAVSVAMVFAVSLSSQPNTDRRHSELEPAPSKSRGGICKNSIAAGDSTILPFTFLILNFCGVIRG